MASPVLESQLLTVEGSNSTDITMIKPAGVVAGDLLVMLISHNKNTNVWAPYPDWVLGSEDEVGGGGPLNLVMYYRISDGLEGASETVPTGSTVTKKVGFYQRWSNVNQGNPIDVVGTYVKTNSDSGVIPALNTSVAEAVSVAHWAFSDSGAGPPFGVSGTGWPASVPAGQEGNTGTGSGGGGNNTAAGFVTKDIPSAGGTLDVSIGPTDGGQWLGFQFAIAPVGDLATTAIHDGAAFQFGTLNIHDGATFIPGVLKIRQGGAWVP